MHLGELKAKPIEELIGIAENMGIENIARSKKQDVIFNILKSHSKNSGEKKGFMNDFSELWGAKGG